MLGPIFVQKPGLLGLLPVLGTSHLVGIFLYPELATTQSVDCQTRSSERKSVRLRIWTSSWARKLQLYPLSAHIVSETQDSLPVCLGLTRFRISIGVNTHAADLLL